MKYDRILLKLSGESLQGEQKYGISTDVLRSYAAQIKAAAASGVRRLTDTLKIKKILC